MQKTYLSREMTRAMALDHPIGDPFGGPAYGERRDPVSAVVSIGAMVGTYGAAGSFAAMTLMQGLAFAGAAISLAGNITGSKTLSRIGMVAGLAGGVGMLAEGVMGEAIGGTLGETFGSSAAATSGEALAQTAAPGLQTPVVDGVAQSFPVDMGGAPVTAELASPVSLNTPGAATGPLNAPGAGASPINAPSAGNLSQTAGPFTARTSTGLAALPGDTGAMAPGFMDSLKAGNYGDALSAAGSNIMDLAKSNPGAAMMMGNAASGVADWLSGKTDAEIAALEAQTGFADARAMQIQEEIAREKRRRNNLNRNVQAAGPGIGVNPNITIPQPWAQQQQQPAPGLIAGARMPTGG